MISSQNNNSYPTCRICRSDEPKSFIAPCKCKGTVKYVHRSCLTQWRKRLGSNGSPQELDTCSLCKFRYVVKKKSKFGNAVTQPGIRFIMTCMIILFLLIPSGYMMKIIMSLTSKYYLRDVGINNIPFCSTLTRMTDIIISKDFYVSMISNVTNKDFWVKMMCNDTIQHLYLGLFFLGSTSNIVTAYLMMDEVLNILNQQQLQRPRLHIPHHHHSHIHVQFHGNLGIQNKNVILWGSCLMVAGFWFHYSLSSFKVSNQEELPLWILRWVTVSTAVFDFGLRRIFWQLNEIDFGDGEILSIQKMDYNEL